MSSLSKAIFFAVGVAGAPRKKAGNGGMKKFLHGAAMSTAVASDMHPQWASTQSTLSALLHNACTIQDASTVTKVSPPGCEMEREFRGWAAAEQKPYVTMSMSEDRKTALVHPTKDMEEEYAYRYEQFAANVGNAYQFNEESNGLAVYGTTKFADMGEAEFLRGHTGMKLSRDDYAKFQDLPEHPSVEMANPSGTKDWVDEGMTTDVKDQGQCGSCWAFSTVEQVESMAIKQGIAPSSDDKYVLAPQELVSCDHGGDSGCGGGLPLNALKWLEKKPLEQESDYPYTSGQTQRSGHCHMKKAKGVIEVDSFKQVSKGKHTEHKLANYVLQEGPLSIGVDANSKWQLYQGGVMEAKDCRGRLDHAVQVVGIDTTASTPFYKVRNSWAASWGEEGYIRLKYGTNTCGIADMAVTATVKKSGEEELVV